MCYLSIEIQEYGSSSTGELIRYSSVDTPPSVSDLNTRTRWPIDSKHCRGGGRGGWLRDLVTVSGGDADESRVLFGWQFGTLVFDSVSQFLTKGSIHDIIKVKFAFQRNPVG